VNPGNQGPFPRVNLIPDLGFPVINQMELIGVWVNRKVET